MIASRRPLLVVTATLVSLTLAASARAEPWSLYRKSPASQAAAPSLLSKEVLLAPMYKLHDGTKKLYAGTLAFHSKVHQGTKKFFVETAGYLSPSNLLPSKKPRSRYGQVRWSSRAKKKRGAADWLIPSWLKPEEPRPSRTVNDFLSQKRPDF